MSRNGAGVYSLPSSYLAETGDTILADQHNSPLEDLQTDANTPRPIVAGGTGASSAVSARTNLSVMSIADIQSGYVPKVATKTALSALDTASFKAAVLTETTREKLWMWKSGDFSTEEAADTDNVNYIAADGVSTSLGCWVAATGDGVTIRAIIAGGTGADNATDALANLGGMASATYDPQEIGDDAFDRANHTGTQSADTITDGTTNKAYTATEQTKLAGIEAGADVTDATNVAAAGAAMKANNLSDLASADTALTNLGGGTAGVTVFKKSTLADLKTYLSYGAADISFTRVASPNIIRDVESRLLDSFSVLDVMTAAQREDVQGFTASEDVTDALNEAVDYCATVTTRGLPADVPPGIFKTGGQVNFRPNVPLIGKGSFCTIFQCSPSSSLTDPAFIMGDADWRSDEGSPTTKGWRLQGIRFETGGVFTGTHTGSDGASTLTDSTEIWTASALVGRTITNTTDGSSGTITANTATTVTATLSGGTDNDWDAGDAYTISSGALGHGLYLIGIAGAIGFDVEVTGFNGTGKYGFILSGNTDPGDAMGVDLGEGAINLEGHYNKFYGLYVFGNSLGAYVGGKTGEGQSNENHIYGAIRQNSVRNFTGGATNSNLLVGSFEAKAGTDFGIYSLADGFQNNIFMKPHFEGTYDTAPWRTTNVSGIKRNKIILPTYGSVYNTVDPRSASFIGDGSGQNALEQIDLNGNHVVYGPNMQYVAPGSVAHGMFSNLIPSFAAVTTDANSTLTVGTSARNIRHSATLTADRTITLSATGAQAGDMFRVTRTGIGSFNLSVGGLKNLTTDTWCEVIYTGSLWVLHQYGAL